MPIYRSNISYCSLQNKFESFYPICSLCSKIERDSVKAHQTMLLPLYLSHSQQKLVYYSASTMVGPNNKKASFEVKICHAAHSASASSS